MDPLAEIEVIDVTTAGKKRKMNYNVPIQRSMNITEEALAIGKVPPEDISFMIANSGHTLLPSDRNLSPRTREMVELSNHIRKSFL